MRTQKPREPEFKELTEALATIRKPGDMYDFMYAILTNAERTRLALRWELVKMLELGVRQRTIARKLRVSLCKITRGSRELQRGRRGFRKVVSRFLAGKKR